MKKDKILIITDNGWIYNKINKLLNIDFPQIKNIFDFRRSNSTVQGIYSESISVLEGIDVKTDYPDIIDNYDKVISLHCKQIFPAELVNAVPCINVHPGYNPYNRGWYPQVFAIINEGIIGATIHLMEEKIDSGKIIIREEVQISPWDTSKEVYEKVLELEINLFTKILLDLVNDSFETFEPELLGKYYSISDFNKLCHLDLTEKLTMKDALNKLRALSHGEYKNAYFIDEFGNKIYVKIELEKNNE